MFAVLKTGGKQYKVQKDSKLLVEKLEGNVGDEVLLKDILVIGDGDKLNLGSPKIADAGVLAEVIKQTRGPKITIIYKRRRKNSRRKQGHKQDLTLIKIKEIASSGIEKIKPKKSSAKNMSVVKEDKKNIKVEGKSSQKQKASEKKTMANKQKPKIKKSKD